MNVILNEPIPIYLNPNIESLLNLIFLTDYSISTIQKLIYNSNSEIQLIEEIQSRYTKEEIQAAKKKATFSKTTLMNHDIEVIPYYSKDYPKSLLQIKDYPPLLFVKGELLKMRLAAVIGSRQTSKYANKITAHVVDWCGQINYGIVSGLANGIDTMAHQYALDNHIYTVAVLPCSLDIIYPFSNSTLAKQIINSGGALISEIAPGLPMTKLSFILRNRIQAALSDIIIPIEMKVKSGTMSTIKFARSYQKPVFVLKPTPIHEREESYQGILKIIENPFHDLHIFSNEKEFSESVKTLLN